VKETSEQAANAARRILTVFDEDRKKIESLGRPAATVLRVFQLIQKKPLLGMPQIVEQLGISFPTASGAVEHMQRLGILRETTGKQRHRLYVYKAYLEILNEGTEPLR
jgi:Fic family protein